MKIECVNCYKTFHKTFLCILHPRITVRGFPGFPGFLLISSSCPRRLDRQGTSHVALDRLVMRLGQVASKKPSGFTLAKNTKK